MTYSIIHDLTESSLIRSKSNIKRYSMRDICDLTFLYLLTIEIFANEPSHSEFARNYVTRTLRAGPNFDNLYFTSTDLHIMLHVLLGKNNEKILPNVGGKDIENAEVADTIYLDKTMVKRYLLNIARGVNDQSFVRRFFLTIQKQLDIDNASYKSIRVLASDWSLQTEFRKKLLVTRLLQAYRFRARLSELRPELERLAKEQKLELTDVANAENPTASATAKPSNLPWWGKAAAAVGAAYGGYQLGKYIGKRW